MCGDTFIQIIRDASIKAAVITLDDIDMPCHEKWSSPLCDWASIVQFNAAPKPYFCHSLFVISLNQWIAFCDF